MSTLEGFHYIQDTSPGPTLINRTCGPSPPGGPRTPGGPCPPLSPSVPGVPGLPSGPGGPFVEKEEGREVEKMKV